MTPASPAGPSAPGIDESRAGESSSFGELRRSRALRAFVPAVYGGADETVAEVAERIAALSGRDADAGWLAAIAAVTNLAVSEFPPAALGEIWGSGPDVLVAGTLAPDGTIVRTRGGGVVDAVSTPASGLPFARWVMATVTEAAIPAGGSPEPGPRRPVRVLVPRDQVEVESTWSAMGLQGAGGDTAFLRGLAVPEHRARLLPPPGDEAPLTFFASLFFSGSVVGMARGAADVVRAAIDRAVESATGVSSTFENAAHGTATPNRAPSRWARPDVRVTATAALRRVDHAEALFAGALTGLTTRESADRAGSRDRARRADLAVSGAAEAEAALPGLLESVGTGSLDPAHPLARASRDITTGARHTALSVAKAALASESALFGGIR